MQELSVSRGTIGDLTQQLSLSHAAREDGAYRAARYLTLQLSEQT